ncbi:hypothetical protein [Caballeronia glebae]|jgi:hypothetical protein|nr:hypothetical protein [Caballeronia glebae]
MEAKQWSWINAPQAYEPAMKTQTNESIYGFLHQRSRNDQEITQ